MSATATTRFGSAPSDFSAIVRTRRAVRAYAPDPVAENTVRALLEAAVQAPTAMHMEPWAFVIIQDRATLKAWSDRAKAQLLAARELPVGWGSTPTHRPASSGHDPLGLLADRNYNIFYDAETLVVVCRTMGGFFADADCWLAAENFMLAATASGLGTCCIGFAVPLLNTPELKRELGVPPEGAAVAPIIVGYPRGPTTPVPRKPPRVLHWKR